ncbi:MAG: HAMP domain-containing protein [Glaciimonas sp.]|nr:HAMP domain-containing protein [Glaciimonas sp.]
MKIVNLKIGTRLGLAFCLVTLFAIISSCVAWTALNTVADKWSEFSSISMEKREFATTGVIKLSDAIHNFKNYLIRGGGYDKKFAADLASLDAVVAGYLKTGSASNREKSLLDEILKGTETYRVAMRKVVAMKSSEIAIQEIDKSIAGADKAIGKALGELMQIAREDTASVGKSFDDTVNSGKQLTAGLAAIVVILSAVCAWLATLSITRPVQRAMKIAQTVASGNLSGRIEVSSTDETGQLLQALKDMNSSLQNIITRVRTGIDTISSASSQIAAGNLDLSSRTEQQASSLEETAASMAELTSTVKQNADNAGQANQLALSASEVASKGGALVSQVVDTMGSINASAHKISDIISVIDGIAFQTNILALNAAVEAARAGEQGRGFAVVATEVRNLAQRSATAAKEIKTLISDSADKVDAGSKLVEQAGVTMEEIVASIKRVTDIMSEITAASQEQSTGIALVNQAINQMDQVTQQNAALVEEAAAAADALQDQAGNLAQVVNVFHLDGEPAGQSAQRLSMRRPLSRT